MENEKCSGCGYIHPPPYGAHCPVALINKQKQEGKGQENEKLIKRFIDALQIEDEEKHKKLVSMIEKILKAYGK